MSKVGLTDSPKTFVNIYQNLTATLSKIFYVHFIQRCENRKLSKTKNKRRNKKINNLMCTLIHGLQSASVVI